MFFTALKNAGVDSGIFDAILIGFALYIVEISADVAAKWRLKAVKTNVVGDVKKFFRNFLTSPATWVLAAFSRHFAATSTEISAK